MEPQPLLTLKARAAPGVLFAGWMALTWFFTAASGQTVTNLAMSVAMFLLICAKLEKQFRLELFEDRVVGPSAGLWASFRGQQSEILLSQLKKSSVPEPPILTIFSFGEERLLRITAEDGSEIVFDGTGILYGLANVKNFLCFLRDRIAEV